jgi:hypothetical protein
MEMKKILSESRWNRSRRPTLQEPLALKKIYTELQAFLLLIVFLKWSNQQLGTIIDQAFVECDR